VAEAPASPGPRERSRSGTPWKRPKVPSAFFTGEDVTAGQGIFLENGLMRYGSIFGPGVQCLIHLRHQRAVWGPGLTCLAGTWSIGIRRLGKIALGSTLRPRYAAGMEDRVWPALVGDQH
jgi:hypothetical protein